MLTNDERPDLDAIEARARAVGVEPWDLPWFYEEGAVLDAHNDIICETTDDDAAAFITNAGYDIPALVAALRAERTRTETLRAALSALVVEVQSQDSQYVIEHSNAFGAALVASVEETRPSLIDAQQVGGEHFGER